MDTSELSLVDIMSNNIAPYSRFLSYQNYDIRFEDLADVRKISFTLILTVILYLFRKYLIKPSYYAHSNISILSKGPFIVNLRYLDKQNRRLILVISSLIYLFGSIFSFTQNQYYLALLQGFTWISSSLYHLSEESMFFNLDNIFANSLLLIFLWATFWSFFFNSYILTAFVVGLHLAAFLFIYCGMPADLIEESTTIKATSKLRGSKFRRQLNLRYGYYHSLWHIVSGIGPFLCTLFFQRYCGDGITPGLVMCEGFLDKYLVFPAVPTISLVLGVLANILGNIFGIMPVP